jgi:hypothetical protein
MKNLVYLVAFLALCGLTKASSINSEIEIYKQHFCTVEQGEQIKRLAPKYSDWLNSYIVALKQGMTFSYEPSIWLDEIDDPIRSAYVVKPNADSVTLTKDGPGSFDSENDEGDEFYTSIADLESHWPSGIYTLYVTFADGHTQTLTTTVPDYNTTPFPDIVSGSVSTGASGQLSLNWSTVDGVGEYEVWAWEMKKNKDVYDSDNIYLTPPQNLTTALTGAYAGKGDYEIGIDAEKDVVSEEFGVEFNTEMHWFSFKKPFVPITNAISKCTVKAGKGDSKDSLSFTGLLDAIAADLIIAEADGNDIVVTIDANEMPVPLEFRFPINGVTFKKGVYNYVNTRSTPKALFKFDTKNGKMTFNAKCIDLTGMACPIEITITIGDYDAPFPLDEDIVNGNKPCPTRSH